MTKSQQKELVERLLEDNGCKYNDAIRGWFLKGRLCVTVNDINDYIKPKDRSESEIKGWVESRIRLASGPTHIRREV